ncbi:hypothetical protein Sru01_60720 [Sphaerisporangium rufum]|uniref:Sporulation protein n=1 Tax=Sphaerisporangium rufum TaxID=1381558 RepID=A0A919V875_9ACTN|nr:spore germination protein GerW family protein [Sphaerisporangium rufum]GII81090.1 hypothetical protein Sru01_60720 [Sphaerisporangium rufum]
MPHIGIPFDIERGGVEIREFFEQLTGAQRVYGEPYEKDGVTVIPAAAVRAGGGFGKGDVRGQVAGGTGGGGGAISRPVGAYVIRDGEVRWEPAVDVSRIVLGAQIVAGLALVVYALRAGLAGRRDAGTR